MPMNPSLKALREARPCNQPGFDNSIERYEALRMQIAATPFAAPRRLPQLTARRRLIGLSAAGAALALAAVLVVLLLTAASPESAYAEATKAVAATSADALDSGTMTLRVTHDSNVWMLNTTRWNGGNISLSEGVGSGNRQLLLVGGEAYVLQDTNGRWMHFASDAVVGPKLGPMVDIARADAAGANVSEILAATSNLEKTVRADGSTSYRGALRNSSADPAVSPSDDDVMRMIVRLRSGNEPGASGGSHSDAQVELIVGSDGLVRQVSVTFQQEGEKLPADNGTWAWSVDYSQLGSTPPISAPDPSDVVESTTVPANTETVPETDSVPTTTETVPG